MIFDEIGQHLAGIDTGRDDVDRARRALDIVRVAHQAGRVGDAWAAYGRFANELEETGAFDDVDGLLGDVRATLGGDDRQIALALWARRARHSRRWSPRGIAVRARVAPVPAISDALTTELVRAWMAAVAERGDPTDGNRAADTCLRQQVADCRIDRRDAAELDAGHLQPMYAALADQNMTPTWFIGTPINGYLEAVPRAAFDRWRTSTVDVGRSWTVTVAQGPVCLADFTLLRPVAPVGSTVSVDDVDCVARLWEPYGDGPLHRVDQCLATVRMLQRPTATCT